MSRSAAAGRAMSRPMVPTSRAASGAWARRRNIAASSEHAEQGRDHADREHDGRDDRQAEPALSVGRWSR